MRLKTRISAEMVRMRKEPGWKMRWAASSYRLRRQARPVSMEPWLEISERCVFGGELMPN